MPDNPMVGYAYQYSDAVNSPRRVEIVKAWAFVHWATVAFDGFGQCVRYEVRLVLPILDSEGRAIRLLRKPTQWADPTAFKPTISAKAKAAAQADLEAEIGKVYAKTGPSKLRYWNGDGLPYP